MKSGLLTVLAATVFLSSPPVTYAAEGGYSNYVPGTYGDFGVALTPDPGLLLRNDIYYYSADESTAVLQGKVRFNLDATFKMNLLTGFYTTELKPLGGTYSFGLLVPVVQTDLEAGVLVGDRTIATDDKATGLGDITLIPLSIFWNFGDLHLNLAHYIVTPTSDYNDDDLANSGLNYWSFDTNAALTYLNPEKGHELSVNIGYIFNTENSATNYQSGKELHADYMVNQYFSDTFGVGIHGFYLHQISGDGGRGATLGDFKAEAAGVGPAVLWSPKLFGKEVPIIVKWLHEFHAKNRLEGDHLMASFVLEF